MAGIISRSLVTGVVSPPPSGPFRHGGSPKPTPPPPVISGPLLAGQTFVDGTALEGTTVELWEDGLGLVGSVGPQGRHWVNWSIAADVASGQTYRARQLSAGGFWSKFSAPVSIGGESYRALVLSDSPIGYWRLGDAGSVAVDASTYGNDGDYAGGVQVGWDGLIEDADKCPYFGGLDGYVRVPNNETFLVLQDFSVECWFRTPAVPGPGEMMLVSQNDVGEWWLSLEDDGGAYRLTVESSLDSLHDRLDSEVVADNQRHHVVWVRDYTLGNHKLWLDGVIVSQGSGLIAHVTYPNDVNIGVGASNVDTTPDSFFDGFIDEVAIYAHALSDVHVLSHYNKGIGA